MFAHREERDATRQALRISQRPRAIPKWGDWIPSLTAQVVFLDLRMGLQSWGRHHGVRLGVLLLKSLSHGTKDCTPINVCTSLPDSPCCTKTQTEHRAQLGAE